MFNTKHIETLSGNKSSCGNCLPDLHSRARSGGMHLPFSTSQAFGKYQIRHLLSETVFPCIMLLLCYFNLSSSEGILLISMFENGRCQICQGIEGHPGQPMNFIHRWRFRAQLAWMCPRAATVHCRNQTILPFSALQPP